MNAERNLDEQQHRSCCQNCGKLLTKPILKIKNIGLTSELFISLISAVQISYGAESKCRRCKMIQRVLVIA